MESNRRVTSIRQLELLVEFLEDHLDLALGKIRSKEGRHVMYRLWAEITEVLNVEGPKRSSKEWAKVWNDLKCRIRSKLISNNSSQRGTGGGSNNTTILTPLEKKVAQILEREYVPQNVFQNHFVNSESDLYKPQVGSGTLNIETNTIQKNGPESLQDCFVVVLNDKDGMSSEIPLTNETVNSAKRPISPPRYKNVESTPKLRKLSLTEIHKKNLNDLSSLFIKRKNQKQINEDAITAKKLEILETQRQHELMKLEKTKTLLDLDIELKKTLLENAKMELELKERIFISR